MKILYVITGLNFGGAETQLMRMVRYVKEKTKDSVQVVSVIEPEYRGFVDELKEMGVPFVSMNLKKSGNYIGALNTYRRVLKEFKPDIIHTHMIHANLIARLFHPASSRSLLLNTVHGEEDFLGKRAKLYHMTEKRVNYTVCVSRALERQMIAASAVSKEKVLTVYNGLSTEVYRFDEAKRKEYREKLGLKDEEFQWIIAGRLSPEKNHKNLLEACTLLNEKAENWHLLVAGEGKTRKELETIIQEDVVLKEKVELLGLRSDVAALLNAADGFVLSSNYEGLPLVLQEAAAVGLPMVSTMVGGCDEVVLEGENGYLVPKQEPKALADAMLRIMELPKEEQAALGAASKKLVEEEFAMGQVMKKWYLLYRGEK